VCDVHFTYLKLTLPNGKTLEIKAPGVSDKKRYVQSLKLNGESYDCSGFHAASTVFSTVGRSMRTNKVHDGSVHCHVRIHHELFSMHLPEKYYEHNEDITEECLVGGYVHGNEPSHFHPVR